eukprot:c55644_g1_i1 orf=3-188(-)
MAPSPEGETCLAFCLNSTKHPEARNYLLSGLALLCLHFLGIISGMLFFYWLVCLSQASPIPI